jgi:putative tricarboxylic transport membrane protein
MTRARFEGERIAGAICILVAAAIALEARTFHIGFLSDPIGPRAMPWLAAVLLGAGGLVILLRPGAEPEWPKATMRGRIAVTVAAFAAYSVLIAPLGFILATTLLMTALARVFEGRVVPGLVAGALFSGAMWLLFVLGLGVPLPIGILFTRAG